MVAEADANNTLAQVRVGKVADYFLYLRPFESTNAYGLSDAHLNLFSWQLWERDGFDDIERLVARALRPTANVVALGRPGEHRGAARILTTDAEWKSEVALLAKSAKLIVVIPANKPGTLWEIAHIKDQGFIQKTIFLMPPSQSAFYVSAQVDIPDKWKSARTVCAEIGVWLPEHVPSGSLFILDEGQKLKSLLPLPAPDPIQWMKALQKLIDDA